MVSPPASVTTKSLVCGDEHFWMECQHAAEARLRVTVRRVLRAAAVQALHQRVRWERGDLPENNNDDGGQRRIVITAQDIAAVQTFCQQLARTWSKACRAAQNHVMGTIIDHVGTTEASTLYFLDHDNNGNHNDDGHNQERHCRPSDSPATAEANLDGHHSSRRPGQPPNWLSQNKTVWGRIYSGLPTQSLSAAIHALDHWGHRRATYWPESWRIVQNAASEIPRRLYKNNVPERVELVTASEAANRPAGNGANNSSSSNNNNNNDDDDDAGEEIIEHRTAAEFLLKRKRKSVKTDRPSSKRTRVSAPPPPDPPPRPASDLGDHLIPFATGLLEGGGMVGAGVDGLILSETNDNASSSLVVGALCNLGDWHHYRQVPLDTESKSRMIGARYLQRRSVAERLGNHETKTNASSHYGSRVVASSSTRAHWREADLQHVMLEVWDEGTQTRHCLAMESLECLLLDESYASKGWHDDPVL